MAGADPQKGIDESYMALVKHFNRFKIPIAQCTRQTGPPDLKSPEELEIALDGLKAAHIELRQRKARGELSARELRMVPVIEGKMQKIPRGGLALTSSQNLSLEEFEDRFRREVLYQPNRP